MDITLPIYKYKDKLVQAFNDNQVVLLKAETGSGKTTQLCQYLREEGYHVVIPEPRRIAAVSNAVRVREELGLSDKSSVVAYHTGFESTEREDTEILFCTDGLQLVRGLAKGGVHLGADASRPVALLLDEVHEWGLEVETLVAWVKHVLKQESTLKVGIMSATLETDELSAYFNNAPVIEVEGRTYPVKSMLLPENEYYEKIVESLKAGKNVLAFRSGKAEINRTVTELNRRGVSGISEVLTLHGDMDMRGQRACFKKYNKPKCIIATNIAQTSITIPDIDVVVDDGLEKRPDCEDGIVGIYTNHISLQDIEQRKGRAGRTKSGEYFLCSNYRFNARDKFSEPAIKRLLLDLVVLRLVAVGLDARELEFFHQPNIEDIEAAYKLLEFLGAIKDNRITACGRRMVKLPLSTRGAKMLVEAEDIGCVSDMIAIVALLEAGSLLSYSDTVSKKYSDFCTERRSDLLAEYRIYRDIQAGNYYPSLSGFGLNQKSFKRASELESKLVRQLEGVLNTSDNKLTADKTALLRKCIIKSMPDMLWRYDTDGYSNATGVVAKLDNKSCVSGGAFLCALPRLITGESRLGVKYSFNILSSVTAVSTEEIYELFNDMLEREYQRDWSYYNAAKDTCILLYEYSLCGLTIETKRFEVKDCEEREHLIQRYELSGSRGVASDDEYIEFPNCTLRLQKSYGEDKSRTIVDKSVLETLRTLGITSLKDKAGKPVIMRYSGSTAMRQAITSEGVEDLYTRVLSMYMQKEWTNFEYSVKNHNASKLKDVLDLCNQANEYEMYIYDTIYTWYKGLVFKGKSVTLFVTKDKQEYLNSTKEAMQAWVKLVVNSTYSDKKLKKLFSKEEWKIKKVSKAFESYVETALAEVGKDNLEETLQFLQDAWDECLSEVEEAKS